MFKNQEICSRRFVQDTCSRNVSKLGQQMSRNVGLRTWKKFVAQNAAVNRARVSRCVAFWFVAAISFFSCYFLRFVSFVHFYRHCRIYALCCNPSSEIQDDIAQFLARLRESLSRKYLTAWSFCRIANQRTGWFDLIWGFHRASSFSEV